MQTTQALQFTIEQVAKQLGLSQSVVFRLSQFFQIPQSYYNVTPGSPRLLLFQAGELEILREVQRRLVDGESLSQIRPLVEAELAMLAQSVVAGLAQDTASADETMDDCLVEYEQDDLLKEHLAQVTFNQYRQNTRPQKPPFVSIMKSLKKHGEAADASHTKTVDSPFRPMNAESNALPPMLRPEIPFASLPGGNPWMSRDLTDRALALQQELRLKSR